MQLYTLADAERAIAKKLHLLRHVDTVIGVPRSGSIFASFIATQLGVGLSDVHSAARSLRVAKHGYHDEAQQWGNVLLVEDVANTGKSLADAAETLRQTLPTAKQVQTCSIWVNPKSQPDVVDFCLAGAHDEQYAFTWQMWHSARWQFWATDFDGVFCDDSPHALKDEAGYRQWMIKAPAKWLPRIKNPKYKVGLIVTSRPEGTRQLTTRWLERHGVRFERLIMAPGDTQLDVRDNLKQLGMSRGMWKAETMSHCLHVELFVESHHEQAQTISQHQPDLLVWCTDNQTRYRNGEPFYG